MKHLKTFEQHNSSEINEIFGWSEKEKLEKFTQEYNKFVGVWSRKGYEAPSEEEKASIFDQAKADKYEGKMGLSKDGKIVYRAESSITWGSEFAGGGTGGMGTGSSK